MGLNQIEQLVRFADLKARGVCGNWAQLKRLQQEQGFPVGRLLGMNSRAWTVSEVAAWLASRPTEKTLKGGRQAPPGTPRPPRR